MARSEQVWHFAQRLHSIFQGELTLQIFPVTYVEPVPEPTTAELQREAQEEAQVFASLGKSSYDPLP
jgi:hypothetical protein